MMMDGLVQYLVSRKWRDFLVLQGQQANDAVAAKAFEDSAKKFGARIVAERLGHRRGHETGDDVGGPANAERHDAGDDAVGILGVRRRREEAMVVGAFDERDDGAGTVCGEGGERAKIMAIAIHPYISGQPFRIKYLEAVYDYMARFPGVLHWNGEQILEWYLKASRKSK